MKRRYASAERRGLLEAGEHTGCVPERIRVGVRDDDARVVGARVAEASRRLHDTPADRRSGVRPCRPHGDEPEQIDVEVAVAGVAALLSGGEQLARPFAALQRARIGHRLDERRASPVEGSGAPAVDLVQEDRDGVAPPDLVGQARSGEKPGGPPVGAAELGRAARSRGGDIHRSPPTGPLSRGLELGRDVLVDAGQQRRAMPDRAVRLVVQHGGQRLVDAAAMLRARVLQNRRPHQRVAEAHGMHVELDDRRVGGRLEVIGVEVRTGGEAAGPHHLAQLLLVVDGGGEQQPPG